MSRFLAGKALPPFAILALSGLPSTGAAQTKTEGNCSPVFVRSTTGNITINCGSGPAWAALRNTLNAILADSRLDNANRDGLVAQLNAIIRQGQERSDKLDVMDQKLDKLTDFVLSYRDRPDELGPALSQVSAQAISFTRSDGPLSLQVVGAFNVGFSRNNQTLNGVRFIFRLSLSGQEQPTDVAVIGNYSSEFGTNMTTDWFLTGDLGTACRFDVASVGMTIPVIVSLTSGYDKSPTSAPISSADLPATIVLNSYCPLFAPNDALDLNLRIYYKLPVVPDPKSKKPPEVTWKGANFRFGGIRAINYPTVKQ